MNRFIKKIAIVAFALTTASTLAPVQASAQHGVNRTGERSSPIIVLRSDRYHRISPSSRFSTHSLRRNHNRARNHLQHRLRNHHVPRIHNRHSNLRRHHSFRFHRRH